LGDNVEISTSNLDLLVWVDRLELLAVLEELLSDGRARLIDNVSGIERNPQLIKLTV
jgi:hypothetical protein